MAGVQRVDSKSNQGLFVPIKKNRSQWTVLPSVQPACIASLLAFRAPQGPSEGRILKPYASLDRRATPGSENPSIRFRPQFIWCGLCAHPPKHAALRKTSQLRLQLGPHRRTLPVKRKALGSLGRTVATARRGTATPRHPPAIDLALGTRHSALSTPPARPRCLPSRG